MKLISNLQRSFGRPFIAAIGACVIVGGWPQWSWGQAARAQSTSTQGTSTQSARPQSAGTQWPVNALDSNGVRLTLASPANRIVALAPGLTELVYSAGAGAKLVARSSYTDYPPQAAGLPEVAGPGRVDHELLLAVRPDLVLAWGSGNPAQALARIARRGVPIFVAEPRQLSDLAGLVRAIGTLAGTPDPADAAATAFELSVAGLTPKRGHTGHADHPTRTYIEIWPEPALTVNGMHLISDIVRRCGGENVFAALPALTPRVGLEDVIAARPEILIASTVTTLPALAERWKMRRRLIPAIQTGRIVMVNADVLHRQSLRIIEGAQIVCRGMRAS